MNIGEWTRIDNLPFNIGSELEYIREEAECLGQIEEWEVCLWTQDKLEKDYPQLFKEFRFDDVVWIEYYPFEWEYGMEEDEFPGYAVYIHFQKELVEKLYNHVIEKHPDYVLSYLNWLERPLETQ